MSFGPSGKRLGPRIIIPTSKPKKTPKVSIGVETCPKCTRKVSVLFGDWDSSDPAVCAGCLHLYSKPRTERTVKITLPSEVIERDQKELERLTKEHLRYLARVRKGQA